MDTAAYGTWPGIAASSLTESAVGFEDLLRDGTDIYWVEMRPELGGSVLVSEDGREVSDPTRGVGSKVHEYGGAATLVVDGTAYWVDMQSQQIFVRRAGSEPEALTPADGKRYLDLEIDPGRSRLLAVCEIHRSDGQPENLVVAIPLEGGAPVPLLRGRDFYSGPRLSPDGSRLAYCTWDHPYMPWDSAQVRLAEIGPDGAICSDRWLAGTREGSAGAPQWSPDGVLHLIVDRDGWWNLHVLDEDGDVVPLVAEAAEHSAPGGRRPAYDVDDRFVVFIAHTVAGRALKRLRRSDGVVEDVETGLADVSVARLAGDRIVFLGGSATTPMSVWSLEPGGAQPRRLRDPGGPDLGPDWLAEPELVSFPTRDGATAHAHFYRPRAPGFNEPGFIAQSPGATNGKPPVVVMVHGGPVSHVSSVLAFGPYAIGTVAFWTSRGYAVANMLYRGTTGLGRPFREALYGRWGELDVTDSADCVRHLAARGDIDPARAVIRGGSAGGWTVLAAATQEPDVFAAGTAYFPVSDLVSFHGTTHKFEAHYDRQLIGPWDRESYAQRSPLTHVDRVRMPLLFLQGSEDKVCPPPQAEAMVEAVRARGGVADYVVFDGEGHGFVRADSIVRSLETEQAFYRQHVVDG